MSDSEVLPALISRFLTHVLGVKVSQKLPSDCPPFLPFPQFIYKRAIPSVNNVWRKPTGTENQV